jgi:hypothetical protein
MQENSDLSNNKQESKSLGCVALFSTAADCGTHYPVNMVAFKEYLLILSFISFVSNT